MFLAGGAGGWRACMKALRPLHWVKNMLVFTALVSSHEASLAPYLVAAALFLAMSALASGTYLFNDLLDAPHDRRHPGKRHRPIASGAVSPGRAMGLSAALVAAGLGGACWLSPAAGVVVGLYLALTTAYSLWLRRFAILDMVVLAVLYTLRVVAGGVVVAVPLSGWLLAVSLFAFLAMAVAKRQNEVRRRGLVVGRPYASADLPVLAAQGGASGMMTIVVFALYIQSPETAVLYHRPEVLWLVCPLLVYWFGRLTLLAGRGKLDDDPVVFAVGDLPSWFTAAAAVAVFLVAMWPPL